MKRLYPGIVAFVLVFLLAACSGVDPLPQAEFDTQHQDGLQLDASDGHEDHLHRSDPNAALEAIDAATKDVVSRGPSGKKIKNLALVGRGERLVTDATTDVWALDGHAYIGTFNEPCGTGENFVSGVGEVQLVDDVEAPGVPIFNVKNPNKPRYLGNLPSVEGSRINDVRVEFLNSGDILVASNEACAGGPGGFEIYNIDDPAKPIHLASVRIDELNATASALFGGITDVGVHNLFLFTQGDQDYVAVTAESAFDNFRIYNITDPTNPELESAWGAEEIFDPGVGDSSDFGRVRDAALWLLDGFGASQNRFLHDITVTEDGMHAYLANWDAGLVLLDISDVGNPQLVSVAIDPTSEDGEVNSHSVWPNENGMIVIEGEEDFAPFKVQLFISEGIAGIYDAAEASFTFPRLADLPNQEFEGPTLYIGLGCDASTVPAAPDDGYIAVVQRGACRFDTKVQNADDAGYDAVIIFNNAAGADSLITPSGDPRELPTIFVGYSTGLAIFGLTPATASELEIGDTGSISELSAIPDGWSGFRIWDYSDPANPVLASTFNTVCSANPLDESCNPNGVYSSHNVIVETLGDRVLAYIAWYFDGMLVLDITDPYNPIEIARYLDENDDGSPNDFWGVYKEKNSPFFYGSDRNGGLYVFKLLGQGTIGK